MSRTPNWISLAVDGWSLGWEASAVIALRLSKLAAMDGAAAAEAQLMIVEKVSAGAALQLKALTGGLGGTPAGALGKSIGHYRKAVRKNRRRLSKGSRSR